MRDAAVGAIARAESPERRTSTARRRALPDDVRRELEAAGSRAKTERLEERLGSARAAFEHERYDDARRILTQLARDAPGAASVRELRGLSLYRLGRWREAARELEAFRLLSGSVTQNPVLADCYRALKRYSEVDDLWDELKAASPSAALVAEGRIVTAGAMADRGDVEAALAVMSPTERVPARVHEHHLRSWYVLADLYERAGDLPRARALFGRIARRRPGFADVRERFSALGP